MPLFTRLANAVARRPKAVVLTWAVLTLAFFGISFMGIGPYGNLEERTETGPPEVNGSDSFIATHAWRDAQPDDTPTTVTAQLTGLNPDDPAVIERLAGPDVTPMEPFTSEGTLHDVALHPEVSVVVSPVGIAPGGLFDFDAFVADPRTPPEALITADGDGMLVTVSVRPQEDQAATLEVHEEVEALLHAMLLDVREIAPQAELHVFSNVLFFNSFDEQLQRDLIVGEAIALPLALIVMVLVFGGFLAASTPIAGAIASIAGGFAVVYGFSFIQDMDSAAPNVVTVLGIGLCIDYGLLIVSRFREETTRARAAGDVDARTTAIVRTMQTAGRTVFFSGVTVAIAVSGLLFFSPEFLTGFGGAALGVVVTAVAVAMTLVPAIAYLYGERIARPGVLSRVPGVRRLLAATSDVEKDEGVFSRLASGVQRRPWLVLVATTGVLLTFAAPALSLNLRNSEGETLPSTDPHRIYLTEFEERFPALAAAAPVATAPIAVMIEGDAADATALIEAFRDVEGIEAVSQPEVYDATPGVVFVGLDIVPSDSGGADAVNIVHALRALDTDQRVYVTGQAANQVDFIDAIKDGMPVAIGLVVLATFLLLFFMTGSLLVPLKALLTNMLSLAASIGILVTIFQYGWFDSLLGIDSLGGVETYVVVLVVSFGFGLAMDYEVFLLARIKELVDRGHPNDEAVRLGLQRSGRIITSAAAIIILVFLGFAAGKVLVIKEVGVGLAIAVFLDATLVRMLLVPATMTLLGKWNWWAPKALRSVYERLGITH